MSRATRKSPGHPSSEAGAPVHRAAGFEGPENADEPTPESLAYRAGFTQLIAAVSRDFLGMTPDQIDRGIEAALRAVGEYAGVDRAVLFQLSDDLSLLVNTHEWYADPVHPQLQKFQGLPTKELPWAGSKISSRKAICVPRVSELPPEARGEKHMWESVGSKSLIILPLEAAGKVLGALGFDTVRNEREWSDDLISLLATAGDVLASALDRKQREEALRESEAKYRAIFESASEAILTVRMSDGGPRFSDFNPAALKLYGCKPEELLGASPADFAPAVQPDGKSTEERIAELSAATTAGKTEFFEWRHLRKDGTIFDAEATLSPVSIGGERYLQAIIRDITERKRAEEERLSLERQLQHARKLESLGVLAGGIAHDFNNILMVILGNTDLALDQLSPMSAARGNLQEIEKASKRAAELAKQMLAYSGKGRFVVEKIDLNELVAEIAHLLEVSVSKKSTLEYDFAADLPTFSGDATQVRQVIMNLITNASEALGGEGGVIALSTGATHCDRAYLDAVDTIPHIGLDEPLSEGVYVHLEVSDTGCGMHAETIEKVFDPFFTTKFTGRGLGMSAVLGIVRGHRGALKVDSEVGKGTTFRILFPVNELADNGCVVRSKAKAEGKDWHGSGTILLVDDEEVLLKVVQRMLEGMGFQVVCVNDGREALEVFRARGDEIACVLLDLTMPRLDGEQVFREIRRLRPDAKVILSSGYDESEVMQRFAGEGLAGFIHKPYRSESLRAKLREVLGS